MSADAHQHARTSVAPPRGRANKGGHQEGAPLPYDEDAPPLPDEPVPDPEDDGWQAEWDATAGAYWFFNRFTGVSQWENPRVPDSTADSYESYDRNNSSNAVESTGVPGLDAPRKLVAGGYIPKIHGNWDPKADYAIQYAKDQGEDEQAKLTAATQQYITTANFNRFNGKQQQAGVGPEMHNDAAKSSRQLNAFFDVDAAANSHDGRSLKAERRDKKLTRKQLKVYKAKSKEKKENKERKWLLASSD